MKSPKAKKAAKTAAKNARKRATRAKERSEAAADHVDAKRAKAYHDMEPRVCDLALAATLAMEVFDQPELFLFAVSQLDDMAQRFRANYYKNEFPPE
jgi:hypothetical protein